MSKDLLGEAVGNHLCFAGLHGEQLNLLAEIILNDRKVLIQPWFFFFGNGSIRSVPNIWSGSTTNVDFKYPWRSMYSCISDRFGTT